jgi:hypothetical protein
MLVESGVQSGEKMRQNATGEQARVGLVVFQRRSQLLAELINDFHQLQTEQRLQVRVFLVPSYLIGLQRFALQQSPQARNSSGADGSSRSSRFPDAVRKHHITNNSQTIITKSSTTIITSCNDYINQTKPVFRVQSVGGTEQKTRKQGKELEANFRVFIRIQIGNKDGEDLFQQTSNHRT